jgi:hypothetical protein
MERNINYGWTELEHGGGRRVGVLICEVNVGVPV